MDLIPFVNPNHLISIKPKLSELLIHDVEKLHFLVICLVAIDHSPDKPTIVAFDESR